jgi:hypothetical protein
MNCKREKYSIFQNYWKAKEYFFVSYAIRGNSVLPIVECDSPHTGVC